MQRFERHQAIHRLRAGEPAGTVRPGEVFVAELMNAFGKRMRRIDEFEAFMQSEEKGRLNHACTGPIRVEGVGRDSSVVVTVRRLVAENAMSCLSKSTGHLRGVFEGRQPKIFEKGEDGYALMHGLLVRADPSIGIIATLDDQDRSPGRCTENGGNIDLPYLSEGSQIYLPVNHPEALIALGDLHFRQGFGEASGMAMEADGEAELQVEAAEKIPYPVIDGRESFAIVGWGPTQKDAQEKAVRNAIDYLRRLPAFRLWKDSDIYQFLGGFGLVPGNSTGNVTTFAVTIRKDAVLDPASRRTVILPPHSRPGAVPTDTQAERDRVLGEAVGRYEELPLVHRGDSREIRAVPGRGDLLVAKLQPRVFSFEARGAIDSPGTDLVRARVNAILSEVLHRAGVSTSTLATQEAFVLMTSEKVAGTVEVVVKTRFGGSPKHRYKGLPDVATRGGANIPVGSAHPPYVRFDWRNTPPDEDQVLPEGLAAQFIDVARAKETVLAAYDALQAHCLGRDLEVVDGCFFLSEDGRVVCGEASCDNLNFAYRGSNPTYQAVFGDRSKDTLLRRWTLLHQLLAQEKTPGSH
jgi:acetamidase/formamidase